MIHEYFWVYYIAFFISGIILTLSMEKKEDFKKKLFVFGVMAFGFGMTNVKAVTPVDESGRDHHRAEEKRRVRSQDRI